MKVETKASNGDVTSTLIIESLTLDDKADVRAVGRNAAGEVSAIAKLNVIGLCPPAVENDSGVPIQLAQCWGPIYKIFHDNLTIMPKLRSTYDGRLIYKTSYNE